MLVPVAATGVLVGRVYASADRMVVSHPAEVPDIRAAMRMMLVRLGTDVRRAADQEHHAGMTPPP